MNFEIIEALIEKSKVMRAPEHLESRQIYSNSRPDPYYNFLRLLALQEQPKGVFLEIGCYHGCVAAHITEDVAIHEHQMVGVDINDVNFHHPDFHLFKGDSNDHEVWRKAKEFGDANCGIFAIFQDASHHYDASVKEWEMYSKLLRPGGVWIADDITPAFRRPEEPKGMVEYFEELPGEKRLYDNLHIGSTIGVVIF